MIGLQHLKGASQSHPKHDLKQLVSYSKVKLIQSYSTGANLPLDLLGAPDLPFFFRKSIAEAFGAFGRCWSLLVAVGRCWLLLVAVGRCWSLSVEAKAPLAASLGAKVRLGL